MKEIGSEFWLEDNSNCESSVFDNLPTGKDRKFFAFGRTSLDYILKDINKAHGVVYMPDYCCRSMIQPFLDNGYRIKYYGVDLVNRSYHVGLNEKCDVFFAMSYFGYSSTNMDKYIREFKRKNTIVIEDITHRFFSSSKYSDYSDYVFCSLRKWLPIISGSFCAKANDNFRVSTDKYSMNKEYIDTRTKAMKLKRQYILGQINDKDEYIKLFSKSNKEIDDYRDKLIDDESFEILKRVDYNEIKAKRCKNAILIHEILAENHISTLELQNGDVPLFVPIFLSSLKQRNNLRDFAISHNIYLPIHWPVENQPKSVQSYIELSLICDQRYNAEEVSQYVGLLMNYLEKCDA